ncbi:MAG: hypothetical protein H0U35_00620 [Sporichthyaceae bacterium]|nr:hypothetical protein [Sporichthyaceae bacterium]
MRRRDFLSTVGVGAAGATLPWGAVSSAALPLRGLAPIPARRADEIVKNYLVNTKIFYAHTAYGHTGAVMDLLTELGVRVIRERITTGSSLGTQNQLRAMPQLARKGIRWHGTVGTLSEWRHAQHANRAVMDFLTSRYAPRVDGDLSQLMHSFGGCNEIEGPRGNGRPDPRWDRHARRMQKALWEQAKSNRLTRGIPIAGPSTRTDFTAKKARRLGDLSRWSELGNAHLYNKGTSPSRGLDEHLRILRPCFPGIRPYIFTESGYNNSPQTNRSRTIPESASAVYAVRGIFDYLQRNAMYGRFELLDDPDRIDRHSQRTINRTAELESHWGLVAMPRDSVRAATPDTWRRKPEFYAIKRLFRLLEDRGPTFTPKPLTMAINGGGRDLHHMLLQKRDGRHFLALWRDVRVSEEYPDARRIKVEPDRINVRLKTARPVRFWSPSLSHRPLEQYAARHEFNIMIKGDLKIVEIG